MAETRPSAPGGSPIPGSYPEAFVGDALNELLFPLVPPSPGVGGRHPPSRVVSMRNLAESLAGVVRASWVSRRHRIGIAPCGQAAVERPGLFATGIAPWPGFQSPGVSTPLPQTLTIRSPRTDQSRSLGFTAWLDRGRLRISSLRRSIESRAYAVASR
jgi:hypothetical protein